MPKIKKHMRGRGEVTKVGQGDDRAVQDAGLLGLVQREKLFHYEEDEQKPAYGSAENFDDYNELVLQYDKHRHFVVALVPPASTVAEIIGIVPCLHGFHLYVSAHFV